MICFSSGVIYLPGGAIFWHDILTELQGISLNDVTGLILEHFGIV